MYMAGIAPIMPYNINPTDPLGVPSVLSLAFFGGIWGILVGFFIENNVPKKFWSKAIIFGSIGPTAVAFLVVFPIKGIAINPIFIPFGLFLNAVWGLGLGLFIKLASRFDKSKKT